MLCIQGITCKFIFIKIFSMRSVILLLLGIAILSFTEWQPNFESAKKTAVREHKFILLNFSGSDWCIPCIRMKKEIFANEDFTKMADKELVLVNADFPRQKKNQLSKEKQAENESLADRYNPKGKFPFTVLLDASGKVLGTWDGLPSSSPQEFSNAVKILCDVNR